MSPVIALGSVGIGMVWGWLLGSFAGRVRHPFRTGIAAGLATAAVAGGCFLLAGSRPLPLLLGATALAALLHAGWRQQLARRVGLRSGPWA